MSDALLLPIRSGLPDEIAYLRANYPKPEWRSHANYGELADYWLRVHDSLREHGRQLDRATQAFRASLSDADQFQRAFVPSFNHFLQHLAGHHQIEDQAYFPKFRALDPRMAAGFDVLEKDHVLIHETLLASVEGARGMIAELAQGGDARLRAVDAYAAHSARLLELLLRHLADEEDLVIPAMLEHGERSIGG